MLIKYSCISCTKPCKRNQKSISCNTCQLWTHFKCISLTKSDFESLQQSNQSYHCLKCIFPFQNLSNDELKELNVNNKLIFPKLSDYKLLDADNCYISTTDFQNLYANNIEFCINIRSLNKNFEKLEELLSVLGKMPEIIAISETKLNLNLKNFLPRYTFIHNNSQTNAGGVRMFIKDTLSYKTTTEYQLNIMGCEEI